MDKDALALSIASARTALEQGVASQCAETVAELARQLELKEWQPIATAPKDCETEIDVIVHYPDNGNSYRVANCHRVYSAKNDCPDTWAQGSTIINYRTYYDDEGDECSEWGNVPGAQRVVTHWMPIPENPK